VAVYESSSDQITIMEAETGNVVKTLKSSNFRKKKQFGGGRTPLALSPRGNLIACQAEDTVVLYNIENASVHPQVGGPP